MLNALLSTSIYKGVPSNKITAFAGEEATGKTFFALNILKYFLDNNKTGFAKYDDTENALSPSTFMSHGIDNSRIIFSQPVTIEEWRYKTIQALEIYNKDESKERPKFMLFLDSLGNLSSEKEITEAEKNSGVKVMSKQSIIKATFSALSVKYLARANVPLIVTNHVYEKIGSYIPAKEISGGSGLKYTASIICMLSKSKDKDEDKETVGNIVKVKLRKSRLAREDSVCEVRLSHKKGMDRYYGLLDLGEESGIIKAVGNKFEFPDGSKHFRKEIENNGEKYFTDKTLLDRLDAAAVDKYSYKLGS